MLFCRSHTLEKCRNEYTGEEEEKEDLVNLSFQEVQGFDDEWKKRVMHQD